IPSSPTAAVSSYSKPLCNNTTAAPFLFILCSGNASSHPMQSRLQTTTTHFLLDSSPHSSSVLPSASQ
ncbi:hypothetical protein C5167_028729, partial [Papaver somniferum]